MNWILIVPLVAFILLALAGWTGWFRAEKRLKNSNHQRDRLNRENESLHKGQELLEDAHKNLLLKDLQFVADNGDLREALQEAQAEIKALQMNTIEVPTQEVKPPEPEQAARYQTVLEAVKPEPKRPARTKKAGTP